MSSSPRAGVPWLVRPALPSGWSYQPGYEGEMRSAEPRASIGTSLDPEPALAAIASRLEAAPGALVLDGWVARSGPLWNVTFDCRVIASGSPFVVGFEDGRAYVEAARGALLAAFDDVVAALDVALRPPHEQTEARSAGRADATRDAAEDREATAAGWPRLPDGWRYGTAIAAEPPPPRWRPPPADTSAHGIPTEATAERPWIDRMGWLRAAFPEAWADLYWDRSQNARAHVTVPDPAPPAERYATRATIDLLRVGERSTVTVRPGAKGALDALARDVDRWLRTPNG